MTAADSLRGVPAEARAGLRTRAAREPLRGLRAVSARVTLTRVLAVARMRDGSRHRGWCHRRSRTSSRGRTATKLPRAAGRGTPRWRLTCELTRARDRGRTGDAHLGRLLGLWGKGLSAAAAEMG